MNIAGARVGKRITWGQGIGVGEVLAVKQNDITEYPAGGLKIRVITGYVDTLGKTWDVGLEIWLDARCVDYLN